MKKSRMWFLSAISSIVLLLSGCTSITTDSSVNSISETSSGTDKTEIQEEIDTHESLEETPLPSSTPEPEESLSESLEKSEESIQPENTLQLSESAFNISDIEPYSGQPYTVVNDNIPYFIETDLTTDSYEYYSDLDSLGRCGVAYASIGLDIMPTEKRGEIGSIKPSGWQTVKYNDYIDGNYLYNRCHLIGYQLSGENANEKNLITGTRYLNVQGMLPFENMVADYVKETENHVLYRVTPIFEGDNLVASGVLMEAESVEDNGDDILFCVYAYNVQPNIIIDYATGDSYLDPNMQTPEPAVTIPEPTAVPTQEPIIVSTPEPTEAPTEEPIVSQQEEPQGTDYILNTNTKKFHYPYCSSVKQMADKNKKEYNGSRDDVISMGYDPCKKCNP